MSNAPKDTDLPLDEKLTRAMAGLLQHAIADAQMVLSMNAEFVSGEHKIKTAATNCVDKVWYNADYLSKLTPSCIRTMQAHEGRHKMYMHGFAPPGKDSRLTNSSMDFIINRDLIADGHDFSAWTKISVDDMCKVLSGTMPAPTGSIIYCDPSLSMDLDHYDIYERLEKAQQAGQKKQQKDGDGDGSGQGAPSNMPGNAVMSDDVNAEDTKAAAEAAGMTMDEAQSAAALDVMQALSAAKSTGHLPGSLQRLLDQMQAPRIDWKRVLRKNVRAAMGPGVIDGLYSFRRPSRRTVPGIILPTVVKLPSPEVVIVADTSGSIGQQEIDTFMGEMRGIVCDFKPSTTHVLSVDTKVHTHAKCKPGEDVRKTVKLVGGGGTNLECVYDYLAKSGIKPACVVFLTDGHTAFTKAPRYPVIWVMTTKVVAPYGKNIAIEVSRG